MGNQNKKNRRSRSDGYITKKSLRFTRDRTNPDKYRAKIDNLDKINSHRFPEGFSTRIFNYDPYIVKIRRFLNTEEIETLLDMAEGRYNRSTIVVDGELVYSDVRTSETAFITENGHHDEYSKPVENVLKKVCYLVGCDRSQIEGLMVVKYGNGEEYYNHHDFFKPEHTDMIADGGQRIATFFVYLSSLTEDEGGETEFPMIGIKSRPSKGTALFWWNTNSDGKLLNKTLHRGNPVNSKNHIKYGLNIWIRSEGW